MIKLIEKLQQSPETFTELIKENINNPNITELLSTPEFLKRVELKLERIEEVPFFIRSVFKIVRMPLQSQILILKEFIEASEDYSIKKLVIHLLQNLQNGQVVNLNDFLNGLYTNINSKNIKEVKSILKQSLEQKFAPCLALLQFLNQINEQYIWRRDAYQQEVFRLLNEALSTLTLYPEYEKLYLMIVTQLLTKTLLNSLDEFSLLTLLLRIQTRHAHYIRQIILNWTNENPKQIPYHVFSSAIFSYFISLFDNKLYYKDNSAEDLSQLTNFCQICYDLIKNDFPFQELGWIAIFSISKWIKLNISEQSLYKCIAFLRENDFEREDIISEILVFNISKQFSQKAFKFIPIHESILETLTPKQLKYLIFKLDQILPVSLKSEIILTTINEKVENLAIMALYFIQTTNIQKQLIQQARQFKTAQLSKFSQVNEQIAHSRYNSLQKEIKIFKERYRYVICNELGCLRIKQKLGISSILRFYKNAFKNDYFSEQYWINEEKIKSLIYCNEVYEQKFDFISDFLLEEKVFNLSGVLLLIELLRERCNTVIDVELRKKQVDLLSIYIDLSLKILKTEVFMSNIAIILDFLLLVSELQLPSAICDQILNFFSTNILKEYMNTLTYTKIRYNTQGIILNLLNQLKLFTKLNDYSAYLTFSREKNEFRLGPKEYLQKITRIYDKYNISTQNQQFQFRQLQNYKQVRKMITAQTQPKDLVECINKISEVFQFYSPLYKGEIVALTHLSHSPEENHYFKNHFIPFIYQQYAKLYASAAEKVNEPQMNMSVFTCSMALLDRILHGDTFSHSEQFYKSLNKSQLVYILLSNKNLSTFSNEHLQKIIHICLQIVEKDNYPLLRQFISVAFCRAYIILNKRSPLNLMRNQIIDQMRVNINIGVPIALTLGYELIQHCKNASKTGQIAKEIDFIHQILVKFISCHTAYLRAICQYYMYLYLELAQTNDQFLINLKQFWKDDKDSQKILTNIAMVVDGFKEAVEQQCDFLGFQRVEEYPTNRLKMEFFGSTAKFYSQFILNQFVSKEFQSEKLYEALNQAASERYEYLKNNYLIEFERFETHAADRATKSNMKKRLKQQAQIQPPKKQKVEKIEKVKKQDHKGKKGKNKEKVVQVNRINATANKIDEKSEPFFKLQENYRLLSSIQQLSSWYRKQLDPKIIVIATLLEKVHNFGHILRTLHGNNAMIVVPSDQPLLHQECKELVPKDCDVQIVEIRHRDLHKFITLMKSLGYPLVALEQCSRSISVQSAQFPEKFMMLLGNERIGAPSSLLNEGDLLVEIPQIGKIRSLNVHVSMVICLWEYLLKQ